ncbi:ligase-associated DNA damage response endonuclease PdeM [Halpernia sp.]|uniref:ligase-associated DNA damage response endonuclease PdeM n=1 Tax=Halpernia sp. TaxID=2782209 RepID=UPI003A93D4B9
MIEVLEKKIENEILIFTNLRAVFWKRENALIISDLHVGKAAHFRKNGIAMPTDILQKDLENLEKLLDFFDVHHLLIVGDLFHAGKNSELYIFCEWRKQFSHLKITLIKGNHDRIKKEFYCDNCIDLIENKLEIPPFTFIHEPKIQEEQFTISGHIHPGVIVGNRKESVKMPCFSYSKNQLILPAFSEFTGLDTKTLKRNFKAIAFTKGLIFEV